ncbi:DUF5134 domain-containing protein [Actinophytocola oryzae]|uniref:Uncharacterized protein DUF5134 n=1 Tax=Actinophytocola oryzae TaxID=502181 RepID=A0A4R7V6F5_9PSEU|nr:DUF5134 domain-containing protein [Actinophytocola oryzae]TDV44267.1 uncharacterized protein DUF5134 [Actinophytocola oryzae]
MFASTALSFVFTVVFAVTGIYSLARLAAVLAGEGTPEDRLVELFHLVMSLAMVGMAWAFVGGPETTGGRAQIVFFGAFTIWFVYRAATHSRLTNGYHFVMAAAMTWMVAAMPLMMGTSGGSSGGGGHHGSAAPSEMPGMDGPATVTPTPGWVTAVTIGFAVLLPAAAGWWALRVLRTDEEARPASSGGVATLAPAVPRVRIDVGCHVLMSLGMAGMLVAML